MAENEAPKPVASATPAAPPEKPKGPENRLTILEDKPKEWLPGKRED